MVKYELWSKNLGTGKSTQLNAEFRSKQSGLKTIKAMNKRKTKYVISGRGFRTRSEAVKWRNNRIKHPPIGSSSEGMRRVLIIKQKPKIEQTKLFLKKVK